MGGMNTGRTVFSQLMDVFPLPEFRRCVERYRGDYKVQSFSCLDQFFTLAFAQLTCRESLRDIEACLGSMQPRLYHMGFRSEVRRNTLANANEQRDWRIYADVAQVLIRRARQLYAHESMEVDLEETVYALPWAPYERSKAAVKMHTLLDVRGSIPSFVLITPGRISDVSVLDQLALEAGSFYVMDRGYIHFARLYRFVLAAAFFVVRARINMQYRRRYSAPVDQSTGLRCDQTIVLTGQDSSRDYPVPARQIHYFDAEHDLRLSILTNHFGLPALTITHLYQARWKVELFFKWIKPHLHVKKFYGTSPNAVKIQLWVALIVYLLVLILRKHLSLVASPYKILQILSLTPFEKMPILQVLQGADSELSSGDVSNQLSLFD
jgi:hypothetical protein